MIKNILEIFESSGNKAVDFDSYTSIKTNLIKDYEESKRIFQKLQSDVFNLSSKDNYGFHVPLLIHFEFFFTKEKKSSLDKELFNNILPVILASYDGYLGFVSGFYGRSNLTIAVIGRSLFEALIILLKIKKNRDLAKRYFLYKEVIKLKYKNENFEITKLEFKNRIKKEFPDWFSEDNKEFKRKTNNWLGYNEYNLRVLAKELGIESQYKSFYKVHSLYIHIQPSIIHQYQESRGVLNTNEKNLFQSYIIILDILYDICITLYDIFGLEENSLQVSCQKNIALYSAQKYYEKI